MTAGRGRVQHSACAANRLLRSAVSRVAAGIRAAATRVGESQVCAEPTFGTGSGAHAWGDARRVVGARFRGRPARRLVLGWRAARREPEMLEREDWLPLARKLDWEFSYVSERDAFPEAVSGTPWLEQAEWRGWDEPYHTSFREYVQVQHQKAQR